MVPDVRSECPRLRSRHEIDNYPGLTLATAVTHAADLDDIVAQYEGFPETACSLPGGHRHAQGVVARTRCGITLRMGLDCGEKWIVGFNAARKRVKDADQHYSSFHRLVVDPPMLVERAARVGERGRRLLRLREILYQQVYAEVVAPIEKRLREIGGKRAEVIIDHGKDPQGNALIERRMLKGLELWERHPTVASLENLETMARILVEDVSSSSLDFASVKALTARLTKLIGAVSKSSAWTDAATSFFTPGNISLLAVDTKATLSIKEGPTLVIVRGGKPLEIDVSVPELSEAWTRALPDNDTSRRVGNRHA